MNVDYRDKSKAITAEDLIRRYNLDGLSKDRKALKTLNDGLTKQDTIIEEYVPEEEITQEQNRQTIVSLYFLEKDKKEFLWGVMPWGEYS